MLMIFNIISIFISLFIVKKTTCVQNQIVICIDHQVFPPHSLIIQLKVHIFKKFLVSLSVKMALHPIMLEHFSFYHYIFVRTLSIPVRLQRLALLFLFLRLREQDTELSELGQYKLLNL